LYSSGRGTASKSHRRHGLAQSEPQRKLRRTAGFGLATRWPRERRRQCLCGASCCNCRNQTDRGATCACACDLLCGPIRGLSAPLRPTYARAHRTRPADAHACTRRVPVAPAGQRRGSSACGAGRRTPSWRTWSWRRAPSATRPDARLIQACAPAPPMAPPHRHRHRSATRHATASRPHPRPRHPLARQLRRAPDRARRSRTRRRGRTAARLRVAPRCRRRPATATLPRTTARPQRTLRSSANGRDLPSSGRGRPARCCLRLRRAQDCRQATRV
jgi:hypothetical protein